MRSGNPEASVHVKDGSRLRGRAALKQVWQDSYDESCILELHARVDMDGLLKEYGDATLQRSAKLVKKSKVPQPIERSEAEMAISEWKAKGYVTASLEAALDGDPAGLTVTYLSFREATKRAEAVAETLDRLDLTGFEGRGAAIREKLKDPLRHADLDTEVESLRDAIDSRRQMEVRRQIETVRERDSRERTTKVLELVSKQPSTEGGAGPVRSPEVAKVLGDAAPTPDAVTNLLEPFTFDAFVVGESNRFAHAAAISVATDPKKAYNPLVIVAGPGLGKTHLLHAIGNEARNRSRGAKVLYLTTQAFDQGLQGGEGDASRDAFRAALTSLDCLLLDDIQGLGGRPEAQAELLHVFESLSRADRHIVLASDRSPKAISDLDERLVSRLESGLVATIQPPGKETRVAILARRARAVRLEVSSEVLGYIADLVEDNVRELGGAFNRVIAFSSVMGRPISRDLAQEVLRDGGGETPAGGKAAPDVLEPDLTPGRSYLVEEDRPAGAFRLLSKALGRGRGGLLITRMNPKRVHEAFGLTADRILWLTDRETKAAETIPPALERIVYEIEGFLAKKPGATVLLDGLEYLVSSNSFEAVLKFVRRLVDTVSEGHSIFLLSVGPATVKEQELKMLEREMDILRLDGTA